MSRFPTIADGQIFAPEQLVVANSHTRAVTAKLDSLGVVVSDVDSDPLLGLELLYLDDESLNKVFEPGRGKKRSPLDQLIRELHEYFRETYHFTPSIGKNRMLAQVGDLHNIGFGGNGLPEMSVEQPQRRVSYPGAGVRVGVADTALYENRWISGAYQAAPFDLLDDDRPLYTDGHAAFVTGLILQQAPGATVTARRVLGDDGQADTWTVAKEIVRFADLGVDVLNLSLGCFTDDDEPPLVLVTALDRLDPDVVVVAAAGNHGHRTDPVRPMWPAALEEVIAVGAVDARGRQCPWSPALDTPWLDAVAIGERVVSTYLRGDVRVPKHPDQEGPWPADELDSQQFDGFASWSGTSFAAATASGAIAAATIPNRYGARAAAQQLLSTSPRTKGVPRIPNKPLLRSASTR